MSVYRERILPRLIHWAMRHEPLTAHRRRVTSAATGRVLEIGIGSGLNLPLYPGAVTRILGVDPSRPLLAKAGTATGSRNVTLVQSTAERLPFVDGTFDTVLVTWTLCSVVDARTSLREMRRVLVAGGHLLFAEHGRSPDRNVQRWQVRLTPLWKHLAGGCHLDRPVRQLVEESGFEILSLDNGYIAGPKVLTFMYEGIARRR